MCLHLDGKLSTHDVCTNSTANNGRAVTTHCCCVNDGYNNNQIILSLAGKCTPPDVVCLRYYVLESG